MKTAQITSTIRLQQVESERALEDYDVIGHDSIHRVTVPHNIQVGDNCNVYHRAGSKNGTPWKGSLERTFTPTLTLTQQ
ncbi:hypothetical protein ABIC83_002385 [Roseateles asaccharophilus]|uniref:hypothetical protein n=1 Tax=Roseateles asaccharophilus TaxID=582607 RepID=UPI00383821DD